MATESGRKPYTGDRRHPIFFKRKLDPAEPFSGLASSALSVFEMEPGSSSMSWFVDTAERYALAGRPLAELCDHNAKVARELGRNQVHRAGLRAMTVVQGQRAPLTAVPRPCPEFSAQFWLRSPLALAPVTKGVQSPKWARCQCHSWDAGLGCCGAGAPSSGLSLLFRLPEVSSPTQKAHTASLITSWGLQAHFHFSFCASTGSRLGFLSFHGRRFPTWGRPEHWVPGAAES